MRNLWQPSELPCEKNKEKRHSVVLSSKLKTELGVKTEIPTNIIDNLLSPFVHSAVALSLSLLHKESHHPFSKEYVTILVRIHYIFNAPSLYRGSLKA